MFVAVPGATGTYCGTRFSWAGIISEVTCGEHHLFGPWKPGPLPLDAHDNVSGPDYEVLFPFTPGPAFGEESDAVLQGNRLSFRRTLQKAVFAMLTGFSGGVADNRVSVRNRRTGLAVTVTGDRPILRYHFFAAPGAVCPEPFVEIHAAPGETIAWEHRYELQDGETNP